MLQFHQSNDACPCFLIVRGPNPSSQTTLVLGRPNVPKSPQKGQIDTRQKNLHQHCSEMMMTNTFPAFFAHCPLQELLELKVRLAWPYTKRPLFVKAGAQNDDCLSKLGKSCKPAIVEFRDYADGLREHPNIGKKLCREVFWAPNSANFNTPAQPRRQACNSSDDDRNSTDMKCRARFQTCSNKCFCASNLPKRILHTTSFHVEHSCDRSGASGCKVRKMTPVLICKNDCVIRVLFRVCFSELFKIEQTGRTKYAPPTLLQDLFKDPKNGLSSNPRKIVIASGKKTKKQHPRHKARSKKHSNSSALRTCCPFIKILVLACLWHTVSDLSTTPSPKLIRLIAFQTRKHDKSKSCVEQIYIVLNNYSKQLNGLPPGLAALF